MEYSKLNTASAPAQELKAQMEQDMHMDMEHPRRFYEMCLVFKCKPDKGVKDPVADSMCDLPGLREGTSEEIQQMEMWRQRREAILKSLQNCGLHLFCYYGRDRDQVLVKVGASAQKLRDTAARMKYKLQLKGQYLNAYAEYRHDFPGTPQRNYKDRRIISHIYKTHTDDDFADSDSIFKSLDKINIIHRIITSKDKDCAGINIGKLLHDGEMKGYFPLHDSATLGEMKFNKLQWFLMPEEFANKLHDYFGDRIAFYFVFMSFYWKWLVPLAAVGVGLQLIDSLVRTPDNITAIPFCILMSIWATCLPHFWRRQETKYAIGWGCLDVVESLEPCRPEHHGEPRINPVTAQVEPYYPWRRRLVHYATSFSIMSVSGGATVLIVCLMLSWRHHLRLGGGGAVAVFWFQFVLVATVEILNCLLTWVARRLTIRENHRTQTEHETHLLAKTLIFKFVNSYFVLYYTAFFKHHQYLFGSQMECWNDDCFLDLSWQLANFVFFRLVFSSVLQLVKPKVNLWWRSLVLERRTVGATLHLALSGRTPVELADMSSAEQQSKKDKYSEFRNCDEILLSHGFATFFAVTSPWVCCAILAASLVEVFLDMRNIIEQQQRPTPRSARTNEPWNTAFDVFGVIAASTNMILLVFTSNEYDSWTTTEKLVLFIYLEHMVFVSRLVVQVAFPAVPNNVTLLQLKQEHMVHRCLENIKVEQEHDYAMLRGKIADHMEVFENDIFEQNEDDDVEPSLQLWESGNLMWQGFKEETASLLPPR